MHEKIPIRSFTDLETWRVGHELVLSIYSITRGFPKDELYGLVSQMRRAAVSITSNIAEGFARHSYKEKVQFYFIAKGSLIELYNQLIIAKDTGMLAGESFTKLESQFMRVQGLLVGLIRKSKSFLS